jgi:F0F1-type ATP synthase membrane subunit b/b'
MSGLDNIVEEIRNQSKQEADEILKEADVFCKDYMNKIKKDVEVEVVSIEKKALADRKLYEEKTVSGMEFLERNSILRAKQQVIEQAIDKARESIAGLNDEEYFNVLEKLLRKNNADNTGNVSWLPLLRILVHRLLPLLLFLKAMQQLVMIYHSQHRMIFHSPLLPSKIPEIMESSPIFLLLKQEKGLSYLHRWGMKFQLIHIRHTFRQKAMSRRCSMPRRKT